jgi:hypothetical protein
VTSHRRRQPRNRRGAYDDQNPECGDRERERHVEGGPGGQGPWVLTKATITAIQPMLITPSATSIAINPMLEPTQHSPNPKPDPAVWRQRRWKCRLSGVSS